MYIKALIMAAHDRTGKQPENGDSSMLGRREHAHLTLRPEVLHRSRNIKVCSWEDVAPDDTGARAYESVLVIDQRAILISLAHHLQSLRSRFPADVQLIVGEESSDDELRRLLLLGVRGFVAYSHVDNALCPAIEAVWEGQLWVPRKVLGLFVDCVSRRSPRKGGGWVTLTSREKMVVESLGQNLSNKEISTALNMSEDTVKFHLKNIFGKLGVHNRHAAVELAKSSHTPETPRK